MKANRWESFLTSWKFFSLLVVLQFILMPVATKDFRFEAAGDIVFYTLQHATNFHTISHIDNSILISIKEKRR